LTAFQGYVFHARLVIRPDIPAQAVFTATMPPDITAVAFELGVDNDPVATPVDVTVVTSDNKEETVRIMSRGTGSLGSRRVTPVFVGFTANRAITAVRFRIPEITSANLILDNVTTAQFAPPAITTNAGVVNGASFQPVIAPNTWITVWGRFLSASSRMWDSPDFSGNRLPTAIEDVKVNINGRPAYVYFIAPGQVNVLTPADLGEGQATVEVIRGNSRSASVTVQAQRVSPALFPLGAENGRYVVATHANNSLVGKTSLYPGASTPAKPGEIITIWGTGFGRTDPAVPNGEIPGGVLRLVATPIVTIGGATAEVTFAGLSGPGVYQFNVRVPEVLSDGDQPVFIQVEGSRTQENAFITVQR
jgi:uncharacterized protein (TIGR03437 family)